MGDTCWHTVKIETQFSCALVTPLSLTLTQENKSYLQFCKFLQLQQMAMS